ncbi:MAG: SDR family NAD-dependent epimerase/dehydratase, partial [Microvirga sp.]
RIVRRPLPIDDPRRRRPDIGLAQELLGWTPKVSLEEGLKATIRWFAGDSAKAPARANSRGKSAGAVPAAAP